MEINFNDFLDKNIKTLHFQISASEKTISLEGIERFFYEEYSKEQKFHKKEEFLQIFFRHKGRLESLSCFYEIN